jgi:hypothetical protein
MADDLALVPLGGPTTPDLLEAAERACVALILAEAEVTNLEAALQQAKDYRDWLARVDVVDKLTHASRSSLTVDGTEVKIEHRLHCHVLKHEHKNVLSWVKDNGRSDLCTCTMSVAFGRNEYALAREFAQKAAVVLGDERPRLVVEEWAIHPQTLKSYIGNTFYKTGRLAEIHPGVQYFNDNVAVVVGAKPSPDEDEENPLGA